MRQTVRRLIIKILALILTFAISLVYIAFRLLLLLPLPNGSYLVHDFKYNLACCCQRVKLQNILHIVINTTLSLISALVIANYCQKLLGIVEWISHQTHVIYLSFVIPKMPSLATYTPSSIVIIYLLLCYLGITTQLSLTLDLIYIYNLPAIYIYKVLALIYSKLLTILKFSLQIVKYDHSKWLTCNHPFLLKTQKFNKIMAIGSILIFSQILVIVAFYYIWLAIVIIVLMCAINFLRNIISLVRSFSIFILAIKGYHEQDQLINNRLQLIKNIQINWIPLIKFHDVRNIFLGRDIIKASLFQTTLETVHHFNLFQIYQCMVHTRNN